MKRRLLLIPALLCAVPLSGCAGMLSGLMGPAPVAQPSGAAPAAISAAVVPPAVLLAVKKRYLDALATYDMALTATDALVATRVVVKGSATALKLHDILLTLKLGLMAAGKAIDASDATSAGELLDSASASVKDLNAAIAAAKGGK